MVSPTRRKLFLKKYLKWKKLVDVMKKYFSNWLDCALTYPVMSFAIPSYALVYRRLRHWAPLHKCYTNSFLVHQVLAALKCTSVNNFGLESQHCCSHSAPNDNTFHSRWKYWKDKCPCKGLEGNNLRRDKFLSSHSLPFVYSHYKPARIRYANSCQLWENQQWYDLLPAWSWTWN